MHMTKHHDVMFMQMTFRPLDTRRTIAIPQRRRVAGNCPFSNAGRTPGLPAFR